MANENQPGKHQNLPPRTQLLRLLTGSWITQSIYAAARLGVAEEMSGGPRSVADLARATGTDESVLGRLLRALMSVGVVSQDDSDRYSLTAVGDCLRGDRPDSLRALAIMMGEEIYKAWGEFLHSVRTGETAFDKAFGESLFEHMEKHPDVRATFDEFIAHTHGAEAQGVVESYDFSGCKTVIDVGGGSGSLLAVILKAYPDMRGVLMELPEALKGASEFLGAAGVGDRSELVGGDFFKSIPEGGDVYVLRHVIHDWDDERSTQILRNCRKAMSSSSKLLIVECVVGLSDTPHSGKFLDLNMIVISGGRERTAEEFEKLLNDAGFDLLRILPTNEPRLGLVEAAPRPD